MLKIIFVIIVFILLGLGVFFYFKSPVRTDLASPFVQNLGRILGFTKTILPKENADNLLNKTKTSAQENAQKSVETVKTTVYNQAKTALDNVFNKQASNEQVVNNQTVNVTVLGVSSTDNVKPSYIIDLSKDSSLNLSLSVNQKYYLKFQNIPKDYCIYINNDKYPLNDGIVEIQFTQGGNFPIKANSCNLNHKNIGTLTVQ